MSLRRLLFMSQFPFWALLLAAFLLLGRSLDARVDATGQVDRTRAELAQVGRVMQRVLDMETGVRGYLITTDAAFLEPYDAAVRGLPDDLAALRTLVAQHPRPGETGAGRLARVNRIEALLTRWQVEVARPEVNAVRKGDRPAAVALVQSRRGKTLIDAVRREVSAYTDAENAFLTASLRTADVRLADLKRALLAALLLALLTGVLSTSAGASMLGRRFEAFSVAARRLSQGERGVQIAERGPTETREVASAFNRMVLDLGSV